ncbi:hypothetical protein [Pseudoclavibacter sp. VKM Ac-2867]|uniref:hypothetical protein n=1 Tax=Pseudoclavibacter sp. VKM Ac-2867 TaxID=2783829 RepID=UPI00188B8C45|nr:hypothetical protein [Pseudoclavibacter sp. VKM Ac-2867]MBF4458618.1 hypothetical protein [Pseudoclavibacter sp. VKM Ac-2867]
MGILVHPDQEVHPAVRWAIVEGLLRVVADHGSGAPWLLARPLERALTEVRTRHLDLIFLTRLSSEPATSVVLRAQGRRFLDELDDLPELLVPSAVMIAKDRTGALRVQGARPGERGQSRPVWLEEGMAAFISDDPRLLEEVFSPRSGHLDRDAWQLIKTIPAGTWLHTQAGRSPRVRALVDDPAPSPSENECTEAGAGATSS